MAENMLEIAKRWKDRFEPKSQHHKKNRIIWATQFIKLLQFSTQEKKLKPEAAIVYKNPPTLATKLTNYKQLSQILPNTDNLGSYAWHVENVLYVETLKIIKIWLKQLVLLFRTEIGKSLI